MANSSFLRKFPNFSKLLLLLLRRARRAMHLCVDGRHHCLPVSSGQAAKACMPMRCSLIFADASPQHSLLTAKRLLLAHPLRCRTCGLSPSAAVCVDCFRVRQQLALAAACCCAAAHLVQPRTPLHSLEVRIFCPCCPTAGLGSRGPRLCDVHVR